MTSTRRATRLLGIFVMAVTGLTGALTLGGGIMFYFSQTLAADLQLAWSGGRFTDVTAGNFTFSGLEIDANSTRFNIGISWWP